MTTTPRSGKTLDRLRSAQRTGLTARVELIGTDTKRITGTVTSVSATGAFVVIAGIMIPTDRIHKVRMVGR